MKSPIDARFDMKRMFFDRAGVLKKTAEKERRVLIKVGSFVRTTARSSIRQRKRPIPGKKRRGRATRPSLPGETPISWEKRGIRRIFFYYDEANLSVGIGPEQFDRRDITGLLELGGSGTVVNGRTRQSYRAQFQPRPFMAPALEKNQQVIMETFEKVRF